MLYYMNKYNIKIISLENCPYSEAAENLMKSNNIKCIIKKVNSTTKEKYKSKKISTFPQIYLEKNKKYILLGGYSDLQNIYDIINSTNKLNVILKKINSILSNDWSRKFKLRLIQILNKNLPPLSM